MNRKKDDRAYVCINDTGSQSTPFMTQEEIDEKKKQIEIEIYHTEHHRELEKQFIFDLH